MPLREFGGRAAGGALGLQHGNAVTNAFGVVAVVFPVPFGAVPDVVATIFDPNPTNYIIKIIAVNALGFTAQINALAVRTVMWMAVD